MTSSASAACAQDYWALIADDGMATKEGSFLRSGAMVRLERRNRYFTGAIVARASRDGVLVRRISPDGLHLCADAPGYRAIPLTNPDAIIGEVVELSIGLR